MGTAPPGRRPAAGPSPWELAAEAIAVKIRWFGLLVGYFLVNLAGHGADQRAVLNAIRSVGALYTLLDTWFSTHGRVSLGRSPADLNPSTAPRIINR